MTKKQKIDVFKPNNVYFWAFLSGAGLWVFIVSKLFGTYGFWLDLLYIPIAIKLLNLIGDYINRKGGYP
jgi:hypothetical protein